ncbi:neuropeptide FF receptor 1-like [Montipora foliosa]|uniref:neuropeptide FF receptor 1-like n=1 Tax=Montipora foliosa TaxID=591990 RepID=UPI0035F1D898
MDDGAKWWTEFVFTVVLLLTGLFGNIFVLVIVLEKGTRKTINAIFVASLACADLVLLCFDSQFSFLRQFDVTVPCVFHAFNLTVVTTGFNAGIFTITSIAVHRCYLVTHPWRPKLKRKNVLMWVSLVWLVAFTFAMPLLFVMKPIGHGRCDEVWPSLGMSRAYTATLTSVQYILPLIVTAIFYLRIWLFLRRRPVVPQSRLKSEITIQEETSRESSVILKIVAVIVLLFSVLLLPTQVAWLLLEFKNVSYDELWTASDILTRMHSCVNPLVYGIMNKGYRQSYFKFFSRMFGFCCHHSSSDSPSTTQSSLGFQP